ncbi:hypothetical protein SLEP1_g31762 [Rubroshorea leprosula]|uniref:Polyprotein n=1 Tax=Rubroshorea leprosula TaxID=152421 RepID=A0AAV5KBA8_9ROSI|nr:hypothetical protein SLEP1_g31762 [Rubroshorea leprosula]
MALFEDEPAKLKVDSSAEQKAHYQKWERANRLSIMVMKKSICSAFKVSVPNETNAKKFLDAIGQRFQESEKAETRELMQKLCNMQYDGVSGIRAHILKMQDIVDRLNSLKVTITEPFLVHQALNSLSISFGQIGTLYNAQKETWHVNQLISICVQEEENQKKQKAESVNLVYQPHLGKDSHSKGYFHHHKRSGFNNRVKGRKFEKKPGYRPTVVRPKADIRKNEVYWFCHEEGHKKRDCAQYRAWLEKKNKEGNLQTFACLETSLIDVPPNSWWLDSGSLIHISNSLQGFVNKRKINEGEVNLHVGNGVKVEVEFILITHNL